MRDSSSCTHMNMHECTYSLNIFDTIATEENGIKLEVKGIVNEN